MPYSTPCPKQVKNLYQAISCPYLLGNWQCGGGDYCPFPPGIDHRCCFICPAFDHCPDKTGVCIRFE